MRFLRAKIVAGAAGAMLAASPAIALTDRQIDWCNNNNHAFSLDLQISGCTAAIQSGRWSGKRLATAFLNRATAYDEKKDDDRAIADLNEAIRLNPQFAGAFNNRGVTFRGRKDYDRSVADFSEAIRLDPKYAQAFFNRGNAYSDKKDYDRAIADFNE